MFASAMEFPDHSILVDRGIRALLGRAVRADSPFLPEQVQPASLDLRLGAEAHVMRASFLPERTSIEERLRELSTGTLSLAEGAVLERGCVYLVPLEEELCLDDAVFARFNPRSSVGRCDVFARVVVPGHPRFDETPRGWRGRPWLEVAPLSFPVRVRRGDSLCQVRFARGAPALGHDELVARYARSPMCHDERGPLAPGAVRFDGTGGLELRVGLRGRDPCAWRARPTSSALHLAEHGAHDAEAFFEPVREEDGHCILAPGRFHLFASRERLAIPPDLAAEMLPVDLGLGELRNNYAGFFDCGFGSHARRPAGTPAVLEVRAHDVPFLVEDGQILFRLRFFRTSESPERIYGEDRPADSYRDQDLTLARSFRARRSP